MAGPGFYEALKKGKDPKVRNRGISRVSVSFKDLRAAWKRDGREGKVTITTRRFIGYRQALQYRETESLWRQFVTVPVVKQMTLEPRREWKSDDVHDGRSKAPSAEYIERHELLDVLARVQSQRFASDERVDPTARLMALEELRAGGIFGAFEQPDWLIEEFQHG